MRTLTTFPGTTRLRSKGKRSDWLCSARLNGRTDVCERFPRLWGVREAGAVAPCKTGMGGGVICSLHLAPRSMDHSSHSALPLVIVAVNNPAVTGRPWPCPEAALMQADSAVNITSELMHPSYDEPHTGTTWPPTPSLKGLLRVTDVTDVTEVTHHRTGNIEIGRTRKQRETGRRGDGETGRRGDGETGRRGDGETGRRGDGETGRRGDGETGRRGEGNW